MTTVRFPRTKGIRNLLRRIGQERHPVRFLSSRLLWRSGLSRRFTIRCQGYRLRFYPTAISAAYWQTPAGGDDDDFIRRYCRDGDTVIDVGANIGSLALAAAAAVGRNGKVFAIEPHPVVFSYLCGNLRMNPALDVEAMNLALGDVQGTLRFSDLASDNFNAIDQAGSLEVPVSTLDALFAQHVGRVRLLKIDVEGYEAFVLNGGRNLIQRTDCVFYESWDRHFERYGCTSQAVASQLAADGFRLFKWQSGRLTTIQLPYRSERLENLIACRDQSELLERLYGAGSAGRAAA